MRQNKDYVSVTAVLLLAFLVIVGVALWLVDLIAQQRVFGLLVSAEFVAFALLVYLFYEEKLEFNKNVVVAGFSALGVLVLLAAVMLAAVCT